MGYEPGPPLARPARPAHRELRRDSASARRLARDALENVLARALSRPPCLLSFSGGRDSSALLSVAVHVARREGLPLPVPATLVFPGNSAADETEWQELVLRHLGVTDRVRLEFRDELDAVGPVASVAMRRHGLLWPFNAHFHVPILEQASTGTVVTGFAGDELRSSSATAYAERFLTGRKLPKLRDALTVGLAVSPAGVRRAVQRRRARSELHELPWLTAEGVRKVAEALAELRSLSPLGWDRRVRQRLWRDRYFRVCKESFAVMADFYDVEMVHPFVEPDVLDALATAGGFGGLGSGEELMVRLFGDLLPERVVRRSSKGAFTDPLWTATSRNFAATWSGGGIDESLVDPVALRRHWLSDTRRLLSTTLLQQAWLHDHVGGRRGATR